MSDLTAFELVLAQGPWVTLGAALFFSPAALWLIAVVAERRLPRRRTECLAVAIGDPALAIAVAAIAQARDGSIVGSPLTGSSAMIAVCGAWLIFGFLQVVAEVRRRTFSRLQATSPTKLWHQFVIYPCLGGLLWTAAVELLGTSGQLGQKMVVLGAAGVWVSCMVIDRRRCVLGHAPFDWRRLRPAPQPWTEASVTLDAWRQRTRTTGAGSSWWPTRRGLRQSVTATAQYEEYGSRTGYCRDCDRVSHRRDRDRLAGCVHAQQQRDRTVASGAGDPSGRRASA